jgi:hypothetical protein
VSYSAEALGELTAHWYTDGDRRGLVAERRRRLDHDELVEVLDLRFALEPFLDRKEPRTRALLIDEAAGKEHRPGLDPWLCLLRQHASCPKQKPSRRYPGEFEDCKCTIERFPDAAVLREKASDPRNAALGYTYKQANVDHKLIRIYRIAARRHSLAAATPELTKANRGWLRGPCDSCHRDIFDGDAILWLRSRSLRWHVECEAPI